jgi:hypothetical protein
MYFTVNKKAWTFREPLKRWSNLGMRFELLFQPHEYFVGKANLSSRKARLNAAWQLKTHAVSSVLHKDLVAQSSRPYFEVAITHAR